MASAKARHMSCRIALVQFQIAHLERGVNAERIERFIQQAVAQQAQVIVFPEDCMTGSIFGDLSRLDTTGETRSLFQKLAETYRIDIVTGSVMEGGKEGNFNTSYYIDAQGTVLARYRKNHLYPSEYRFLQPGHEVPVFDTAYGKAGIVICWDMLFPEIFERLKAQGVQLIYCPSYWYREIAESMSQINPLSEEQQMDALCVVRSIETNAAVVYVNAAGEQVYSNGSKDTLIGHSQVTMPVFGALCKLDHHDEELIVQDVDLAYLAQSAKIYHA